MTMLSRKMKISNVSNKNFEQEGDYQEGDVDQEGMDIEYFSQYKVLSSRHDFDGYKNLSSNFIFPI